MTKRTVWKFLLPVGDDVQVAMPSGAMVLSVYNGAQSGFEDELMLWALVDPDAPLESRRFRIAGTGDKLTEPQLRFIGTVRMQDGLVWHVFEVPR